MSDQIALKKRNQNPRNIMVASFSSASTGKLFTSAGRDFDSAIKFNASTGEEYRKWFACGTEVAFDRH